MEAVMVVGWNDELVEQLDWYWREMLRPRLEGLTDAEFAWEPVPGCGSVRPAGKGRYVPDWEWPAPVPAPVTTIGWRLCHIGGPVLGLRASSHFGDGSWTLETVDWPGTATAGIAFVERGYAAWKAGVVALGEAGLSEKVGPAEGPYSESPFAALILHINREVIHHGAEVALLRDLYCNCDVRS
jgi:hypothetical protein